MIFQHTWQAVMDGRKTQTRRLVRKHGDGEDDFTNRSSYWGMDEYGSDTICVVWRKGKIKWQVSRTYAVQPGRGQPAVGRIRLTGIRAEHVTDISEEDALAEGCEPGPWEETTIRPGVATHALVFKVRKPARVVFAELWDTIHTKPGTRWDDNPAVWVLEFELVEEEAAA